MLASRREDPSPSDDTAVAAAGSFEVDASHVRSQPLTVLVPAVTGVLLWSIVCWSPLEIELAAVESRASTVLGYLVPLALLGVGLLLRNAVVTVVGLPVSLSVVFALLQPLDLRTLNTLPGALTLGGALVLFVLSAVVFAPGRERRPRVLSEPLRGEVNPAFRRILWHAWPRLVMLVVLFVVPLYALYGAGGDALIEENFPDRRTDALVLVHTVHLFVSVLVAYLFFLSPSINEPLEVAELRKKLAAADQPAQLGRYRRNLVIYLLIGLVLVALFAWLRSTGRAG